MTLQSKRSPQFADVSDADLIARAINAQRERAQIMATQDATNDIGEHIDTEDELDRLEQLLFHLDDELCARDLDWPKV